MTVSVTTLKLTHSEAIIKVTGVSGDSTTITLDSLLPYGAVIVPAGTIVTSDASTTVTGTNTAFASNWVGAKLYKSDGTYLGTVATVVGPTELTLGNNAAATYTGAFKGQFYSDVLDGTRQVAIAGVTYTGAAAGVATITRNSAVIMTLLAANQGQIDLTGHQMVPDTVNAGSDIVVTITGGQTEVWLKLRKLAGYTSTVEYEKYGAYDDETRKGASTILSGSPDKV